MWPAPMKVCSLPTSFCCNRSRTRSRSSKSVDDQISAGMVAQAPTFSARALVPTTSAACALLGSSWVA